jgi:hypothetical protein
MARELSFFKSNINFANLIDTFLFRVRHAKLNPERLPTDGIICFCGEQGSGKTLSAVNYVYNLASAYPRSVICTNITLTWDLDNDIVPYTGPEAMLNFDNGDFGVIFLLDEMHIEFNSLESKGMDSHIFELVSQQRKARKHIVGTSQVFGRLAKPFREQFKYAVCCDNFFGLIFRQRIYRAFNIATSDDITTRLLPRATKFFIPCPADFTRYDTTQIIRRIRDNGFNRP